MNLCGREEREREEHHKISLTSYISLALGCAEQEFRKKKYLELLRQAEYMSFI